MEDVQTIDSVSWFHEEDGQRKGPKSEDEIISLIKSGKITKATPVWRKDFSDWMRLENTELKTYLPSDVPPPLSGEHVNNTVVWVLAFGPLIGQFLEYIVAGALSHGNEYLARVAVENNRYWFVTLALNIGLSYFDAKRLKDAGHDTDKFKGWVWIVPVYLYQRAKTLNQNLAYFIVWIACFVVTLLG